MTKYLEFKGTVDKIFRKPKNIIKLFCHYLIWKAEALKKCEFCKYMMNKCENINGVYIYRGIFKKPGLTMFFRSFPSLITSYLILSYLILSYLILSYLILSHLILSHLILSYLILSYQHWNVTKKSIANPILQNCKLQFWFFEALQICNFSLISRFAFKRGDVVPQFHYETRAFRNLINQLIIF